MNTKSIIRSMLTWILISIFICSFAACNNAEVEHPNNVIEYSSLNGDILQISKYGNVILSTTKEAMRSNGYEYGDIVTVTFGSRSIDVPYCSNYSDVDAGQPGLFGKSDDEIVILAVNTGNFATTYEIADKTDAGEWMYHEGYSATTHFVIAMKEKKGYYDEYVVRQLRYTDNRSDYEHLSDEQFANFREINTTGIEKGVLYRPATPVDPTVARSPFVDAVAKKYGITVILDLADDQDTLTAYETYADSCFAGAEYVALDMGVDFGDSDFEQKLKHGLQFIAENPGVYLIHCKEGKDRTGFVCALLELLMGADYLEAQDDYMVTYYNYYGVEKGDEKYDVIASKNFDKILERTFDVNDVSNANWQQATTDYLLRIGLTEDEIIALKTNLGSQE